MSSILVYCRFCAEEKPSDATINFLSAAEHRAEVIEKLSLFTNNFVDFDNKTLPECICEPCFKSLEFTYKFFLKVKASQEFLESIVPKESSIENVENTDDRYYETQLEEAPPQSWSSYPWICSNCDLTTNSLASLGDHTKSTHNTCHGFTCADCHEKVDELEEFVAHVIRHREELRLCCIYCDHYALDPAGNVLHLATHVDAGDTCRLCGDMFPHKRKLRRHELRNTSPLVPPLQKKRKGLVTDEDLTCKTCGAILQSKPSLKAHKNRHKVREKHYTCEKCGLAYYTKGSLNAHRKIHENTKKESCRICQKSFLNLTRLKKHVRTHNLERPFQCDVCNKCFSSKERLRSHISLHMDVLPFVCACGKKFRHRSLLKVHENQHTGAKPYSCSFCEMVFSNWSNCNKHMKRKHDSTLARSAMTPRGKVPLNPQTGKPEPLEINSVVKEWSQQLLASKKKRK